MDVSTTDKYLSR